MSEVGRTFHDIEFVATPFAKDLGSDVEGKPTKLRYTEVQESPTFYKYRAEASKDGGPWTVIAEGKITKVR